FTASVFFSDSFRKTIVGFSNSVVATYDDATSSVSNFINEHFDQRDEIRLLREENKKLNETAELSLAFASRLNAYLKEENLQEYNPKMKLVRALSYANFEDYNKVWLEFSGFDKDKIYGLTYQGYTIGIVVESLGKPLAILQEDPKSIFSVYVGAQKMKGVAFGLKDKIEIRYIPLWSKPSVGDEVYTSGLDDIFFEGLKVGNVSNVYEVDGYYTALVEPYAKVDVPSFFHVITKDDNKSLE
ncbi:MAG: rod shape-determining protein MreC, partial [Campylobacteraceae bacterium]